MTDRSKLAEARAVYENFDRISRNTRRVTPSAPWIIPALLTAVAIAGIFCLAVKLIAKYLLSKRKTVKRFDRGARSDSPSSGSAANRASRGDQTSVSTATPRPCGPLTNMTTKHQRSKPPPVSLYQMKQKKSPGSSSGSKIKLATLQVGLLRAAHGRSGGGDQGRAQTSSDDNSNNDPGSSPVDMSQRSSDTEEISHMSPLDDSQAVGANEVVESHQQQAFEQDNSHQQQAESDI